MANNQKSMSTEGSSELRTLGDDPSNYLEKFEEWYEHTSPLVDSVGLKGKT